MLKFLIVFFAFALYFCMAISPYLKDKYPDLVK